MVHEYIKLHSVCALAVVVMFLECRYCSVPVVLIPACPSTFQNNVGVTGGIVAMPYGPLLMEGHNVFLNNAGAALRVGSY